MSVSRMNGSDLSVVRISLRTALAEKESQRSLNDPRLEGEGLVPCPRKGTRDPLICIAPSGLSTNFLSSPGAHAPG